VRVLVTCPPMLGMIDEFRPLFAMSGVEVDAPLVVQTLSEEELCSKLPDFDGWIIGDDPATARVLEAGSAGRLKAVIKWGVGVDNVDFDAARRLGLPATNTPGVFGREVADLATHYVTGLARETFLIDREIREKKSWPKPRGISLSGRKAGIVGFGDIGKNTAKRLQAAEMEVVVFDPLFAPGEGDAVRAGAWPVGVEGCDFLIFTAPLNSSTHHMFNEQLLGRLKPGVRVVNVGRGPVIAEQALIQGLETGLVHSAALDVFEIEPLPAESPLRQFERCIFGSHNASNTEDAVRRVSEEAIERLLGFLGVAYSGGARS
jgi:D-3-phosphoglycerate dehydrogenase